MGKRILVVDGAPFMRRMMQDILQKSGYEVAGACGSFAEALRLTKTLAPDAVITDIVLQETEKDKEQNGFVLIQTLQKQCPAVPCVVCTGVNAASTWKLASEAGAKGFIAKPANAQTVCSELEKALNA